MLLQLFFWQGAKYTRPDFKSEIAMRDQATPTYSEQKPITTNEHKTRKIVSLWSFQFTVCSKWAPICWKCNYNSNIFTYVESQRETLERGIQVKV